MGHRAQTNTAIMRDHPQYLHDVAFMRYLPELLRMKNLYHAHTQIGAAKVGGRRLPKWDET